MLRTLENYRARVLWGGNEFLSVYKAFIEVIGKAVVLLVIFDFNL